MIGSGSAGRTGAGGLRGLIDGALPKDRFGDHRAILAGTGQNIAGLAVYVLASFASASW